MISNHMLLAPHIQAFFVEHLVQHKRASPKTITSYRDAFRLWLMFMKESTRIEPAALHLTDLDAPVVLQFLDHLEQDRGNSVKSRNLRLAALRTFVRFLALRAPETIGMTSRVLAIPVKRTDKKLIGYLSRDEVDALLAAPDPSRWIGRRAHAVLLTLYNSGARVSEVTTLQREQICFGPRTFLELTGKGRKERTVPLWPHTSRTLQAWFDELGSYGQGVAFPSTRGKSLSRDSVAYLIKQAAQRATSQCPSLGAKKVTPHMIRHTTAMHLMQAGVDINVIALWLGHESIETTNIYLEADLTQKERALAKLAPVEGEISRFTADDSLLTFLNSL